LKAEVFLNRLSEAEQRFKIFLDMDGVLCDFERAMKVIDLGLFVQHKIDNSKSWGMIGNAGVEYWSDMPWTPDGKLLWSKLKSLKPTILSSTPRLERGVVHQNAKEGKRIWLQRELGNDMAKRAMIVPYKKLKQKYSGKRNILIDDFRSNIEDWENKGGIGILHKDALTTIKKLKELGAL